MKKRCWTEILAHSEGVLVQALSTEASTKHHSPCQHFNPRMVEPDPATMASEAKVLATAMIAGMRKLWLKEMHASQEKR
jgi:hypothetical protein